MDPSKSRLFIAPLREYKRAALDYAEKMAGRPLMFTLEGDRTYEVRWRAPHHTCSAFGMRQEIELARQGSKVLFLEDLPEFSSQVLQVVSYYGMGDLTIVATALPCACGWGGGMGRLSGCVCQAETLVRYNNRLRKLIGVAGLDEIKVIYVAT